METKSLHFEKTVIRATFIMLFCTFGIIKSRAQITIYDFSAVCETGQTLYYKHLSEYANNEVAVVAPIWESGIAFWGSYAKPTGAMCIPDQVTNNDTTYNVISINPNAFWACNQLTSVTIPNSIQKIGGWAFSGCTSLSSITIPNSVQKIDYRAFNGCTSLSSITIPNSVQKIDFGAFSYCSNLESIDLPVYISELKYETFMECSSLQSIVIPDSVQQIGERAFENCSSLTSINIPISVQQIGENAFYGCYNITNLDWNAINCPYIPMQNGQHWLNSNLLTVNIGDAVETLPYRFLYNCRHITEISISNSVSDIKEEAFYGCDGLSEINIPNTVTYIGSHAFSGCKFKSIVIPNSVERMGEAFSDCHQLTTVYYNAENGYGSSSFANCPTLTTLYIGPDVREIGDVFSGCNTAHLVVALGDTPAALSGTAFADLPDNSILIVPCGKRLTYYAAWNKFDYNNIIEDCNNYTVNLGTVGSGGNVTTSATQAQMGETVTLTVTPEPGMSLLSLTIANANDQTQIIPVTQTGKDTSTYTFTMPPFEVIVLATFTPNVSVEEHSNIEANVYPNPTNGVVKIEAENIRQVSIFNMIGQMIYDGVTDGSEFVYDFGKHDAGLYLVNIRTNRGETVRRVVVE